jgi:competence protein ComFC
VLRLKYRADRRLGEVMGGWLAELWRETGWQADLITAVPLSAARLRHRGYNQARLLGDALGRQIGLPLHEAALVRGRETGTQVGLGPTERKQNVAGAFEAARQVVEGKAIIVVDDLFTTGSTLEACAASLINAGASRVHGLTVARAGHNDQGADIHGGHYDHESPHQRPSIRPHGPDA